MMFRNEKEFFDNHFEYNFFRKLLKKGKNLTNIPNFLIKYRVHPQAESVYDEKNQEHLMEEVLEKFKELEDPASFFDKAYYSIKLFFHYLRTMNEKKILIKILKE